MKKLSKFLFVIIVIFSLSLNVLLLYDKNNSVDNNDIKSNDIVDNNDKIDLDKETISKLFKDYLIESQLIEPNSLAVFDITKITNVGYFKSNQNRKLYYIEEKYNCLEGIDCVKTNFEIKTDEEFNNYTTLVVAVTPMDKNTAIFEILDYSIEKDSDFQSINPVEIK